MMPGGRVTDRQHDVSVLVRIFLLAILFGLIVGISIKYQLI